MHRNKYKIKRHFFNFWTNPILITKRQVSIFAINTDLDYVFGNGKIWNSLLGRIASQY